MKRHQPLLLIPALLWVAQAPAATLVHSYSADDPLTTVNGSGVVTNMNDSGPGFDYGGGVETIDFVAGQASRNHRILVTPQQFAGTNTVFQNQFSVGSALGDPGVTPANAGSSSGSVLSGFASGAIELWFNPIINTNTTDRVLFESGASGNGFTVMYRNTGLLRAWGSDGSNQLFDFTLNVSGIADLTTDWMQVVLNMDSAGSGSASLHARSAAGGAEVSSSGTISGGAAWDTIAGANNSGMWSAADDTGPGASDSNAGGRDNENPGAYFQAIALVNAYSGTLDATEREATFLAQIPEPASLMLAAAALPLLLSRRR